MREIVGCALNAKNLGQVDFREVAIDRVGALARATDLGRALFHWAYGGDEGSARSAYHHLCRKARRHIRLWKGHKEYKLLERVAAMVLHEWRHPACHECGGRGETDAAKLRVVCQQCGGTGLHRYEDVLRRDWMQVDHQTYTRWEKNVSLVANCLTAEDVRAVRTCVFNLERRGARPEDVEAAKARMEGIGRHMGYI